MNRVSTEGSITKRCTCKDPATGRRLGSQCPKLRRPGGAGWHASHGTWGYQLELPVAAGRPRRQLRRGGFDDRNDAVAERDHARSLLDLAGDDQHLAVQIADLLQACRPGQPLPERDAVAARVRAGVPATVPTTTGEYLQQWLAGRRGLAEKTMRGYRDHITKYLVPHLGNVPLQGLRTGHVEAMFAALEQRNEQIRAARALTSDTYTSVILELQRSNADAVADLIPRDSAA